VQAHFACRGLPRFFPQIQLAGVNITSVDLHYRRRGRTNTARTQDWVMVTDLGGRVKGNV
jgi:hypothetical protein